MFNSVSASQHGAPAPSGQMTAASTGMEALAGNDGAEPVLKSRQEPACARAGTRHAHEQAQGRFGNTGVKTCQRQQRRKDRRMATKQRSEVPDHRVVSDRRVAATSKSPRTTAEGTTPVGPTSAMPASTSSRPTASPALPSTPSPPR